MSYQPVVPFGGYAGWRFMARTEAQQRTAFEASSILRKDEEYYRDNIAHAKTAEDLVSDRRLLRVTLSAFGLEDDLNNTYFIRKVLEDGTLDSGDLANKLADKRYLELAKTLGYGDYSVANTQMSDFADGILADYRDRQFEIAVGKQDETLRLALNARRELADLAASDSSDTTLWYKVLGSEPLRTVFETAFGLPSSFASLDIDRQVGVLRDRAASVLGAGTIAQFTDGDRVEALIRRYTLLADTGAGSASAPGAGALALLRGSSSSAGANILSLLRG